MLLELVGNKVLIQPRYDPSTSEGGIIIPDVAKERCDQGIVKYIGPKVRDLKVGDYVLFGGYDGTTIQFGEKVEDTLILIHEPFIKCVIRNINVEVPGLYFRSRISDEELRKDLGSALMPLSVSSASVDETIDHILEIFGSHDPYFPATYEIATQIIMEAFSHEPKRLNVVNKIYDREKTEYLEGREDED